MEYYNLKTMSGEHKVRIERNNYSANNCLALVLYEDNGEFFDYLTKNLIGYSLEEDEAFVDTNNCSWAEKFIRDNKLGKKQNVIGYSGFCKYPLYKFNLEKIFK